MNKGDLSYKILTLQDYMEDNPDMPDEEWQQCCGELEELLEEMEKE